MAGALDAPSVLGRAPSRGGATSRSPRRSSGFTLVELVVVISLMGILAAVGARLMSRPMSLLGQGADQLLLADEANRALARMADELQQALPNSVRISEQGSRVFVEFLPVSGVLRYRSRQAASGDPGDVLNFTDPLDSRFDVLGPLPTLGADTQMVIHNLGQDGSDAYVGTNRRSGLVLHSSTRQLSFTANGAFPEESPTARAALVEPAVSFVCVPEADGSGRLLRMSGYGIQAAQPVDLDQPPLRDARRAVLAAGVTACAAQLDAALQNMGVVSLRLQMLRNDAKADLVQQVALDLTP